jgi:branched-chain amino acid transport system substrate-binding protein
MLDKNFERVAILSGSSAYSIGLKNFFLDVAKQKNLNIVVSEDYLADAVDFRTNLQKIKVTNPDAFLLNPQTGQAAARIAEQARALGITSQFYGIYFTGPEFIKIGAAVEGTYIADTPSLNNSNPRVVAFKESTVKRYGSEPNYLFFGANAYDQVYLVADMFKKVGTEDTDKMKSYLYDLKDFDGISGKFGFDSNGDVTGIGMILTQVKNGEVVPAQ